MRIAILILVLGLLLGLSRCLLSGILNVKVEGAFLNKLIWMLMRDALAVMVVLMIFRLADQ